MIEDDLRAVSAKIAEARTKRTRAEVEKETTENSLREARLILKEEFGISEISQADDVLKDLEVEIFEAIKSIEDSLERAEN